MARSSFLESRSVGQLGCIQETLEQGWSGRVARKEERNSAKNCTGDEGMEGIEKRALGRYRDMYKQTYVSQVFIHSPTDMDRSTSDMIDE